jgi:hypothetical protein
MHWDTIDLSDKLMNLNRAGHSRFLPLSGQYRAQTLLGVHDAAAS